MSPEQAFGVILKELRTEKGLSQERLAFNSGLDRTFISMLERGKRQPSLTSIIILAEALSVPAHVLVQKTTDLLA